ncbi:MAG: UDP-N-acetylmuramoyl-tripeptide--D-alanyl-D-alanine ligase [Acidobacteriaceae bacterium]|nr:UDP-N-acetylmuramoyl-tripeptide--D-alanyl-D-alanine ligase [Acidobacteriaceae bacterium]MBV9442153.1 UDP-N-acetylmuramoyl-tripeptide--D-alanyl-D-alanine ligase [Acidobacteriaceae bacterium]
MKWLAFAGFCVFAWRRLQTYLHIYQQEEYQPIRFLRWLVTTQSFDKRASLSILLVAAIEWLSSAFRPYAAAAVGSELILFTFLEKNPRKSSKKPLVMTGRAKRIFYVAGTVCAILAFLTAWFNAPAIVWLVLVQLVPVTLPFANLLLTPYERSVQNRFWNEAHQKLLALKPTVVGITGSFGKTSTKHILGHVLELQAPTLITPGSVNTPMGISRVIREHLGSHHRFFVCEMGAYGPGSIARLCRLAPPDLAVITAIGMAHYERFKTLDTVAQTKFELAESVVARGGRIIAAEQVLEFEYAKRFRDRHRSQTIVCGASANCDVRISNAGQNAAGIFAELDWNGAVYHLRAPLFGEHHISNLVLAFIAACSLGVSPEDAVLALASTPQIKHRLEIKSGPAGARLIDDAYNSNPVGFTSGLRLLSKLQTNGGRRILVTPGMVELGTAHEQEHEKIGVLAGQHVDVLVPVLPDRIRSLTEAYLRTRPEGVVVPVENFGKAEAWMSSNLKSADVVLLENDLPDLYEMKLRL